MNFIYKMAYLLCFFVTACQSASQNNSRDKKVYVRLGDQEMSSFAREVEGTDNLKLLGSGGGFFDGIDSLSLTFDSSEYPNIDEARRLFIDISDRLLNRVNKNEALRPYLVDYPFTIDNIDLLILFPRDKIGSITAVTMGKAYKFLVHLRQSIMYQGYDHDKQEVILMFKEPYQEARNIVDNPYQESSATD